jgi:hypothetical protein
VYLEQINFEKVYLLCKDLPANPLPDQNYRNSGPAMEQGVTEKLLPALPGVKRKSPRPD